MKANCMQNQLKQFGQVKVNVPMSRYTTFRLGGTVDYLVTVENNENLVGLLRFLDGEGAPYFTLGGGSNMLVSDEGFRGVAIQIKNQKSKIKDEIVECEAGCVTVAIAEQSMKAGLTGFEWGVGVPGTLGGAVRGNAGAMGGEMKDVVEFVEVYRNGEIAKLGNEECKFGYRDSIFKHTGGVILRATLKLNKVKPSQSEAEPRTEPLRGSGTGDLMKKALEYLQYRMKTQPQGHSIGCIFKNVEMKEQGAKSKEQMSRIKIPDEFFEKGKIPAGWLVEQAGLKGRRAGNAQVSERHGNFIVNLGGATATDVLTLIDEIKTAVYDRFGIALEEEIQTL